MTRRVVTTRRAQEDIEAAVTHYLDEGALDAAAAFVDALEDTTRLISRHPEIGSSRFAVELDLPGLRDFSLRRFPYVILYGDVRDTVSVYRILHMEP